MLMVGGVANGPPGVVGFLKARVIDRLSVTGADSSATDDPSAQCHGLATRSKSPTDKYDE